MSLASRVAALATRIGQEVRELRAGFGSLVTVPSAVITPFGTVEILWVRARRVGGVCVVTMVVSAPEGGAVSIGSIREEWRPPGGTPVLVQSASAQYRGVVYSNGSLSLFGIPASTSISVSFAHAT